MSAPSDALQRASPFALLSDAVTTQMLRAYLKDNSNNFPATPAAVGLDIFEDIVVQRDLVRFFQKAADKILTKIGLSSSAKSPHSAANVAAITLAIQALGKPASFSFLSASNVKVTWLSSQLVSAIDAQLSQAFPDAIAESARLLEEISRYIIEIQLMLSPFDSKYSAESVLQLLRSAEDLDAFIDAVSGLEQQRWSLSKSGKVDPDFLKYETDYRFAVVRELDKVELFGVDMRPEAQRNLLSDAFVSLNVQHDTDGREEFISFAGMLDSMAGQSRRLLIRGSAGSGKSTLLRWAAISAAKHGSANFFSEREFAKEVISNRYDSGENITLDEMREITTKVDNWRNRIPFLILLRNCQNGQLPTASKIPLHISRDLGLAPKRWIQQVLSSERGIILIDGIDEVPLLNRESIRTSLRQLIKRYPNAYFILTTRPEAVPRGWLRDLQFVEADVVPMSVHEIGRFIRRWHDAVKKESIRRGRPIEDIQKLATDLTERLKNDAVVSPLASNPLLCAMICALHQYRSGKIPNNLRNICESLCEMLLHRREIEGGLSITSFEPPWPEMQYEQKRYITQEIATRLVLDEASSMSTEDALQCVARALDELPNRNSSESPGVLRALIERSGMLREAKPRTEEKTGSIDFIHNTFKEFLAGERFAVRGNSEFLVQSCFRDPVWKRVALFAVSSNNETFSNEFIGKLVELSQAEDRTSRSRREIELFALQCRAVAISLNPELNNKLAILLTQVFPPKSLDDGQLIASLGEIAVPFLDWRPRMSEIEAAACVRGLRLINNREAREKMPPYMNDERQSVVQELAFWTNPLTIPQICRLLREGRSLPDGVAEQIVDLQPLADISGLEILGLSSASNADFATFPTLLGLRTISIVGSRLRTLQWITRCPNLTSINLSRSHIEDIAPIASLTNLQDLDLQGCPILDFRPVAEMNSLTSLNLSDTAFRELSILTGLHSLRSLAINSTRVTDLGPLQHFENLISLNARGCSIAELDLNKLPTKITVLDLSSNPIDMMKNEAGYCALEELDLRGTKIKDYSPIASIGSLRNLKIDLTESDNMRALAMNASLSINGMTHAQWAASYLRNLIFVSYSHADERWYNILEKHLQSTGEQFAIWSDKRIKPGYNWREEIRGALSKSKVGVLLVSSAFLASDFIRRVELSSLLRDAKECGVRILWIPIDSCMYEQTPLNEIQAVFDPKRPLKGMREVEAEAKLLDAARSILDAYRAGAIVSD